MVEARDIGSSVIRRLFWSLYLDLFDSYHDRLDVNWIYRYHARYSKTRQEIRFGVCKFVVSSKLDMDADITSRFF